MTTNYVKRKTSSINRQSYKNFKLLVPKGHLGLWKNKCCQNFSTFKSHFVCSSMKSPPYFAEEVNRVNFDFIWSHKPPKVKKSTLIKSKKEGGLEMKDFAIFDKALKLNKVKRLCSDYDAPWKYIPTSLLANVGGTLLFQCNYDCNSLKLNKHLPSFYKDIITCWQKVTANCPQTKSEVLDQIIWNNSRGTQREKTGKRLRMQFSAFSYPFMAF